MGHYEERLSSDLNKIQETVVEIENKVIGAVENAVNSLLNGDAKLAYNTVIDDHEINRMVRDCDESCLHFIAIHIPTGKHLRTIHATIRVLRELERIGDYASTICRESVQLSRPLEGGIITKHIEKMCDLARTCFRQSTSAFFKKDKKLAIETIHLSNKAIEYFNTFFDGLLDNENDEDWKRKDRFTFLIIFYMLRRVSDQAKNIGKEAIFSAGIPTDHARVFPILFIDQDNRNLGLMAKAIGEKKFGSCGKYETAGVSAGKEVSSNVLNYFEGKHPSIVLDRPKEFDDSIRLEDYYIVVCLNLKIKDVLKGPLPFHTLALEWELDEVSDLKTSEEQIEKIYRSLSLELDDLMSRLCGPRACCD